jgi:hypothetical protein
MLYALPTGMVYGYVSQCFVAVDGGRVGRQVAHHQHFELVQQGPRSIDSPFLRTNASIGSRSARVVGGVGEHHSASHSVFGDLHYVAGGLHYIAHRIRAFYGQRVGKQVRGFGVKAQGRFRSQAMERVVGAAHSGPHAVAHPDASHLAVEPRRIGRPVCNVVGICPH